MYRRIRDLREDKDDIPTDVLIKLADFYHTSTDYLLGRTDEKQAYPASKSRNEG